MYNLAILKDTIIIQPWNFSKHQSNVILDKLNNKFANKVIYDVGMCLAIWDILKIEDSLVLPGDGATHTNVTFRAIMFRPFIDEVLVGKIKSCSKEGVQISIGFFDDIHIRPDYLQETSRFDSREQVWIWQYEDNGEAHDLFMDINAKIRFRVISETFNDLSPTGPNTNDSTDNPIEIENVTPYEIYGSISEPGLGLLTWWNQT